MIPFQSRNQVLLFEQNITGSETFLVNFQDDDTDAREIANL